MTPTQADRPLSRLFVAMLAVTIVALAVAGAASAGSKTFFWAPGQPGDTAGRRFAIQPMWSNKAFDAGKDGCAVLR